MRKVWTRKALMRRIDRCYLVAAWTKASEKRRHYIGKARLYRELLSRISDTPWRPAAL